jgi:dihydroneopterin aldolase
MFREEKILGNDFEVNMDVVIDAPEKISKLHQSVDYVALHAIIKEVMDVPTPLLETVVQELAERVGLFDNKIKLVTVSVKKLNPPIINFQGTVGISYSKAFS